MAQAGAPAFAIGHRCQDSHGSRGTVRYVGGVATSKNPETVWIGVEWDDATRGKHDGSVEKDGTTTRYFRCAPGAGSFVKPSKVKGGLDFLGAMIERYVKNADAVPQEEMYVNTMRGNRVAIEQVSCPRVARRQQIDENENISLKGSDVAFAGEPGAIAEACGNIVDLNLTSAMLHAWEAVAQIAAQLPRLEQLELSHNRLVRICAASPIPPSLGGGGGGGGGSGCFGALRVLVLNNTGTRWGWVQRLEDMGAFPTLEELHLCSNGISSFDADDEAAVERAEAEDAAAAAAAADAGGASAAEATAPAAAEEEGAAAAAAAAAAGGGGAVLAALATARAAAEAKVGQVACKYVRGFVNLRSLWLSDNRLSSWSSLQPISRLPLLAHLGLSSNQLPSVGPRSVPAIDRTAEGAECFDELASISLSSNRIGAWASIDNLASYPCLSVLRLRSVPLLRNMGTSESRHVMIGRLAALRTFNNAEVRSKERIEAEKSYVLRVWCELNSTATTGAPDPEAAAAAVLALHPRYEFLLARWGVPQVAQHLREGGNLSLGAQLVSLTIRSNCADTMTIEPFMKKVPLSMTVKSLKMLCVRHFGDKSPSLPATRLTYAADGGEFPIDMDQDDRDLLYFGVQDGGKIVMDEKDADEETKAREREVEGQQKLLDAELAKEEVMNGMVDAQRAQEAASVAASATRS